jgi:3-dehydroquinate dehydratase I
MICISISESSQLLPVIEAGAELVELRFDLIGLHPSELCPKIPDGIKTVVTCREGKYNEQERIEILNAAIELGADYVDLELESSDEFVSGIMPVAEKHGCEVIFSHHDFLETPGIDELRSKMELCFKRGGLIAKVATQIHKQEDVINLLFLYSQPGRKIVLGMGDAGRITRVAAPLLGSEFTFASPDEGSETAPGQMSASQLNAIYNLLNG